MDDSMQVQMAAQAAEIDSLKRERARIVMRWNSTITELDRAETQIKQLKQDLSISAVQDELDDWIHSNKIDVLQRENVELRAQLTARIEPVEPVPYSQVEHKFFKMFDAAYRRAILQNLGGFSDEIMREARSHEHERRLFKSLFAVPQPSAQPATDWSAS